MLSLSTAAAATTIAAAINHHLTPKLNEKCFLSPPLRLSTSSSSASAAVVPSHHRRHKPLISTMIRCCCFCSPHNGARYTAVSGSNLMSEKSVEEINNNNDNNKLKIGIIGFGNFGQFMAKTMVKQGHTVLAYSRSDYSRAAQLIGVRFFFDADDLCEEHPEVILLCTSILSMERVLRALPLHRLRRSTLIADVLSVKEFPRSLFLQLLPRDFDILCTHPMFGPDSGKAGWAGLPFVFDKVRVGSDPARKTRIDSFLNIFEHAGCRMVEMSCVEHDKHAAGSQFITHMMGRVLEKVGLVNTPINTKGYESLLNLVDNTARDSFELFYGLFLYNKNAMEELERMHWAFETVKQQLTGHLHGLVRKQLMLETNSGNNINNHDINNDNDKKLMLPPPCVGSKIVSDPQHEHDFVINGGSP